jgi:predicted HTH domain antitoxin
VTIEVPESELGSKQLTSAEVRLNLAVGFYSGRGVTLGQAASLARVSQTEFLHELGRRGLCINYTAEDAEYDVRVAIELAEAAQKQKRG